MGALLIGAEVRIHAHGHDYTGEVVASSRSRATVRYSDIHGDERLVKLCTSEVGTCPSR